ncbi:G protein-coupled glucose receptor regulating Gpa2-domain-containing protein [Calycina marina]|uniref:G protein-coupled glucose receptor regulating Gpa2-domain-containing protein n=1 Tax=Calycina marina TaxID=1763456 RepID=A0A9P7Z9A3_9HELO|nr:G protein-coupled glucose receptor regulating Gpa2-domain-containing protein [Calycina marina]
MVLDDSSKTLERLPSVLSHGLVAVSFFGLLSFLCSASLFIFLTWKMIAWRLSRRSKVPINQFLFLIYNLLFADAQQALAFLLNISHLRQNAIVVGDTNCWAQGWFVSTGDLASTLFIFAIGLHTFLALVKDTRLPSWAFYSGIASLWIFNYVLAIAGPFTYGKNFYVRANAWCWIGNEFKAQRLWLHYLWIFIFMFSTVTLYMCIFFFLRRRSRATHEILPNSTHGATSLMLIYPLIYVVCTSPLAIGRIVSLAGGEPSLAFFCISGSMISCNGWLDVVLYASTRSGIVFGEDPTNDHTGLETFLFMGKSYTMGTTTTIQAGNHFRSNSKLPRGDSAENLYGLNQIAVKGEVTVVSEAIGDSKRRNNQSDDSGEEGWDSKSTKSGRSHL